MKVLLVNKFLHPNGGSETYIFKLGDELKRMGHDVEYFGMDHPKRCVGNSVEVYTSNMDFHNASKLTKLTYPIKTIYSKEANVKFRQVLDSFNPDAIHLNNINFQLTPSIIQEARKWQSEQKRKLKIVFTAHDYQLVCPNHMFRRPKEHENCEQCVGDRFYNCFKNKCIHGSFAKSLVGTIEAYFWKLANVYKQIDTIICPSAFMKGKLDTNPLFKTKTVTLHNFIDQLEWIYTPKKDYVLYFGRYSKEKGIETLINVCKILPDVQFVFAGSGPLENQLDNIPNIKNVGFQTGKNLEMLIREAKFSLHTAEWYENCPFSVMESQMFGTPVIGANIGGIPELVNSGITGDLFTSGSIEELREQILTLLNDEAKLEQYTRNCKSISFDTISKYCEKILSFYV